jgi:hypothetical protein
VCRGVPLIMSKHLYEIFELAAEAKNREEKKKVLLDNSCLALRDIVKGSYDDSIKFTLLPKGQPPYTPNPEPKASLIEKSKTLRYFVTGGPGEKLNTVKRESMFIELLESIHEKDAQLIVWMKDKKLAQKYKGITKQLCSSVWDGLIKK